MIGQRSDPHGTRPGQCPFDPLDEEAARLPSGPESRNHAPQRRAGIDLAPASISRVFRVRCVLAVTAATAMPFGHAAALPAFVGEVNGLVPTVYFARKGPGTHAGAADKGVFGASMQPGSGGGRTSPTHPMHFFNTTGAARLGKRRPLRSRWRWSHFDSPPNPT